MGKEVIVVIINRSFFCLFFIYLYFGFTDFFLSSSGKVGDTGAHTF